MKSEIIDIEEIDAVALRIWEGHCSTEDFDDRQKDLEDITNILVEYLGKYIKGGYNIKTTNKVCPKCHKKVDFKKVSEGYFCACLNCDEDFYEFELVDRK